MTWKSNDKKTSISGDNVSACVFIAVTTMEHRFRSICSIALLNSNCTAGVLVLMDVVGRCVLA